MVEVAFNRLSRMRRREILFPQEKPKERATQKFWRDEATIVSVRQGGQMDMAVDQGFTR